MTEFWWLDRPASRPTCVVCRCVLCERQREMQKKWRETVRVLDELRKEKNHGDKV